MVKDTRDVIVLSIEEFRAVQELVSLVGMWDMPMRDDFEKVLARAQEALRERR